MPSLSDTITRLSAFRAMQQRPPFPTADDRLTTLTGFGNNPGALGARVHIPAGLRPGSPLVVVLHGCTQTPAGYDRGSGWSQLADLHGFGLLFPEQTRANNGHLCFNWFEPGDIARDAGEAMSIRLMIERVAGDHRIDRSRIFVTGLSAGGAMAGALLATYPELFAGGAIVSGLPYGVARSVPEALERMRGKGLPSPSVLEALVRRASSHRGPWPRLSVWQGGADRTVHPSNAEAILAQWRGLHGLEAEPARVDALEGHARWTWVGADGRAVLEHVGLADLDHGLPIAADGAPGGGEAGPFFLPAGLSSTRHIARFWDLIPASAYPEASPPPKDAPRASGVGTVIEKALRAAGLLK